jgi:transcriptional regulator with XRE-family HTH domain
MSSFSENLHDLRISHGFTQASLAQKLSVSPSTIGMYEQGRREPDSRMLKKISTIFHTSIDRVLGFEPTKCDDIDEVVRDFAFELRSQKSLMLKGRPIGEEDRKKIADAIKMAARIVLNCDD